MRLIWYVAVGSAVGGVARFLIGGAVQGRAASSFPVGTLVVNITGALLLGFLVRSVLASPSVSMEARALLTTGLCGGYTTFSTFGYETLLLIEVGDYRRAALYIVLSISLGLAATFAGAMAGDALVGGRRA